MQADSDHPTPVSLIDDALSAAMNVSSSVGLLSDLYGELGISRQDADARNLARILAMIHAEAEKVSRMLEQASGQARATAPGARPSPAADSRPRRTASARL